MTNSKIDPLSPLGAGQLNLTNENPIAFFSAEYAIKNSLPIYAGGLGVLAGDMVLEAQVEDVPFVGFGVLYSYGFDTAGENISRLDPVAAGFELVEAADGKELTATVVCNDRDVIVQAWQKHYGSARLILLNTDVDQNNTEDRGLTDHLYDSNVITRTCQEWVIGLAGAQFLRLLDLTPPVHHINEGHTAFVIVGLILEYLNQHPGSTLEEARVAVRQTVVASKHTILSGAGLFIDRLVLKGIAGAALRGLNFDELFALGTTPGRPDHFSTTKFILDHARAVNGVSKLHVAKEKADHTNSRLIPITNGVASSRWLAQSFRDRGVDVLSDAELWKLHTDNRSRLVSMVNDSLSSKLDPNVLTVVWARRIAAYKRPALLFNDLTSLEGLVTDTRRPIQFIIAGKANSGDEEAKRILEEILKYCQLPKLIGHVVYLPGYSPPTTQALAAGADLWLNTPIRGQEACGTSGMKASLNGALQLSTSDGWIDEVEAECIGWKLPEEGIESVLYKTLEQRVAPLFYDMDAEGIPTVWVKQMRETMKLINKDFTARRMLQDYMTKLYFPST
jgi:glycogen phosphorylase